MSTQLVITLIVFILMILGFVQSKVSRAVVALGAMAVLVLTGCLDAKTALSGFSNSNTILMATMFVVSEAFSRTQTVSKISRLLGKVSKGSFTVVMAGYVVITMLLANVAGSSSAAFAIIFPMAFAVCDELGFTRSKMLFALGIVSIGTCAALPIGGSAATYAQFNGYLESLGATQRMGILDPMIARLPAVIALCLYAIFLAPKFSPSLPPVLTENGAKSGKKREPLAPWREKVCVAVFVLVIVGLLFADKLGIDGWMITLIGALIIATTGILSTKEVYSAASLGGIVMMYVGVLGVGNALTATGAGEAIGNAVASMLGGTTNGYVIGLVCFLVPFLLTQVLNNRAVGSIFAPISIMTCMALGVNPVGPLMLSNAGALTAFMTPMATATVNMVMGLGGYSQKDLIKMSILPAIILTIVNVVWVMTIYPV